MPFESFLYALTADPAAGALFTSPIVMFPVVMGALAAFGLWLLATSSSGPDGLYSKGVRLFGMGRYAEAEQCYRKALEADTGLKPPQRKRLLIRLGNALMHMGRFQEARTYLEAALPLAEGDPDGSSRASLADCLLLQDADPQKALDWAEEAVQAGTDRRAEIAGAGPRGQHLANLMRAEGWAQRAWALARLGRQSEGQESTGLALKLAIPSCAALKRGGSFQLASPASALFHLAGVYWRTGMAALAMGQRDTAREHFKLASDADPRGEYGGLGRQQLDLLGGSSG